MSFHAEIALLLALCGVANLGLLFLLLRRRKNRDAGYVLQDEAATIVCNAYGLLPEEAENISDTISALLIGHVQEGLIMQLPGSQRTLRSRLEMLPGPRRYYWPPTSPATGGALERSKRRALLLVDQCVLRRTLASRIAAVFLHALELVEWLKSGSGEGKTTLSSEGHDASENRPRASLFSKLSLAWDSAAQRLGGSCVCRFLSRLTSPDEAKVLPVDAPGGTSNSCRINEPSGHGARAASFFGRNQDRFEQKDAKETKDLMAFGLVLFGLFFVAVFAGFRPR